MNTPEGRRKALADILEQRVLVLDGAMGTMLQQRHLTAEDFGGPRVAALRATPSDAKHMLDQARTMNASRDRRGAGSTGGA